MTNSTVSRQQSTHHGHINFQKRLNELQAMGKLLSSHQLQRMDATVKELRLFLPGPVTPEILTRTDQSIYMDWKRFARDEYSTLLDALLEKFDKNWPKEANEIFQIDANSEFVIGTITALTSAKYKHKISQLSKILEGILKSETMLFSSFVDLSFLHDENNDVSDIAQNYLNKECDDYVQLLMSLPNKVANEMQHSMDTIFMPEIYSEVLLTNLLKAIHFMGHVNMIEGRLLFGTSFLSKLFSRIIIDFNFNKNSKALKDTLNVLSDWSSRDEAKKHLINELFLGLNRQAIDVITNFLLQGNYELANIIGDAVGKSKDWKYCLTTKIPLLSVFKNDAAPLTLTRYFIVIDSQNDSFLVEALLDELLDIWSNNSCMLHTSVDQHIYITKLVILLVAAQIRAKGEGIMSNKVVANIKQKLFKGIPIHIQSQNNTLRCIGMITAEIVISSLDTNEKDEKLKFDYNGFSVNDLALIECLKDLSKRLEESIRTDAVDGNSLLDAMIKRIGVNEMSQPQKVSKSLQTPSLPSKPLTPPVTITDETLDSDDDLEPYDMSNDVSGAIQEMPLYLLDLKETLLDAKEANVFIKSIENCPQLIQDQLPKDDIKLGLDILEILLCLDNKFGMDNFEMYRLSGCVAACCVYPKECAQYLCQEFHRKVGTYSIGTKVLILEILSESAIALSKINKPDAVTDNMTNNRKIKETPKKIIASTELDKTRLAQQIIRARVEKKTKRFATITEHPLKNAQVNRFSDVAGYFFFPLLHGFGEQQLTLTMNKSLQYDVDNVLLVNFLFAITTIMLAAQNCPIVAKMAKEAIRISTVMRYSGEPKIRLAVLRMVGTIFLAVPQYLLVSEFFDDLCEIRLWLEACCCQPNMVRRSGETDDECREFAAHVLTLCVSVLNG